MRAASASFVASIAVLAAALPAAAASVVIPGGTPLEIHLTDEMTSSSAKPGDRFSFTVANDVRDPEGWLVIPSGAQGIGEVADVQGAGSNGHSGKLGLQFDYVYAVDGEKVKVSSTGKTEEGEQKKGAASTATIASYALLGPVGLFAHNWIKGRDATIPATKIFTIFVDDTVHVEATNHIKQGDGGFAH